MIDWVVVPFMVFGLRMARFHSRGDSGVSWATMIKPSPYVNSLCSIWPWSPWTFRRTSKPNASHNHSIAATASWYTTALAMRGQSLGVGFISHLRNQILTE
jgi:hypothetical protein